MRLSLLKKCLFAAPVLLAACQSREFNPAEPDALKGVKASDGERLALAFSDLNPAAAKARMEAAIESAKQAHGLASIPNRCKMADGSILPNNGTAIPDDNSVVYYCKNGSLKKATENRFLKELVQEAGATDDELTDVKIYLVPVPIANAWAYSPKQGRGHIVVYQGLMQPDPKDSSYKPVADDGALAGVIVHELGHIKDMRKSGFTNLNDRRDSLLRFCNIYVDKFETPEEFHAKQETCFLRMQALTRTYEHNADANVPVTFKRQLPNLALNPYRLGDWFEALGTGKTDPTYSHPDGKERNFYLTKALQEEGIPKDIPARNTTVKATVNSMAD